jgi:hypothetical protein
MASRGAELGLSDEERRQRLESIAELRRCVYKNKTKIKIKIKIKKDNKVGALRVLQSSGGACVQKQNKN